MRKAAIVFSLAGALALPSSALAFHHTSIPAPECAAAAAGSPSNNNGMAKERLAAQTNRGGQAAGLPLPPVGTPGAGQGQGDDHCANSVR